MRIDWSIIYTDNGKNAERASELSYLAFSLDPSFLRDSCSSERFDRVQFSSRRHGKGRASGKCPGKQKVKAGVGGIRGHPSTHIIENASQPWRRGTHRRGCKYEIEVT